MAKRKSGIGVFNEEVWDSSAKVILVLDSKYTVVLMDAVDAAVKAAPRKRLFKTLQKELSEKMAY